jgi:hypothetical protein
MVEVLAICALIGSMAPSLTAQGSGASRFASIEKATADTMRATGTFDVQLTPQSSDSTEGSTLGRMSISKKLHGDLTGTSEGEMLTAMTKTEGSAGYVAVERVTGTLHGKRGSFVLQHTGIMARGEQQLTITVVPDSGTDDLIGITGSMSIAISNGSHSYEFEYTLPQ